MSNDQVHQQALQRGGRLGANFEDRDPEKLFNLFCRWFEDDLEQVRKENDSNRGAMERAWVELTKAPVMFFDRAGYSNAMQAVQSAEKMDLFLPPVMPFESVVLVDGGGVVFFWDAVDYEDGDKRQKFQEPGGQVYEASVLREVHAAVFMHAGDDLNDDQALMTMMYARVSITAPRPDRSVRGVGCRDVAVSLSWLRGGLNRRVCNMQSLRVNAAGVEMADGLFRDFVNGIATGLDELYYVDLPRHHLVIEEPINRKRRDNAPKQARAHERIRLRLIAPEDVRKVYPDRPVVEGQETKSRDMVPHQRRGHTKYLKSERWVGKRWQRIRVRPTWVGPHEWELGRCRYRVVVRKNDTVSLPAAAVEGK